MILKTVIVLCAVASISWGYEIPKNSLILVSDVRSTSFDVDGVLKYVKPRDYARMACVVDKIMKDRPIADDGSELILQTAKSIPIARMHDCDPAISILYGDQRQSRENRGFLKSQSIFWALKSAVTRCDDEAYNIFAENYKLALGDEDYPKGYLYLKGDGRVEKVLTYSMYAHSSLCQPLHVSEFKDEIARVDPTSVAFVDAIFDSSFQEQVFGSADIGSIIVQGRASILKKLVRVSDRLFEGAVKHIEGLENLRAGRKESHHEVISRNLFGSCLNYSKKLAVFARAQFDQALDNRRISENIIRKNVQFSDSWIKYVLCDALVSGQEKIKKLLMKWLLR